MNEYHKKLQEAGHVLKRDEFDEIDRFALNEGLHNGPACIQCGASWCHHCRPKITKCKKTLRADK